MICRRRLGEYKCSIGVRIGYILGLYQNNGTGVGLS